MISNCSNLLDQRNLQEQVKKHSVTKNCSGDLEISENSPPSALNFKSFSQSLEQFFHTVVGQNNFGNKILIIQSFSSHLSQNF